MTPTDTVVSEARRVLTECLDAFDDEVAEALMGGSERASWPDIDVPVEALRTLLAIDRRTATPQSGGVVVKEEDWRDDPASDERWNAGVNYAITQLCEVLGVDPKSISWDAATETLDGDVSSVLCNAIRGAYGDDWTSDPAVTARIRSTLADPIPEAPADEEEVEGLNEVELKNQASRCPCRGSNDMCVCQNVPDAHTRDERGLPRAHHPDDEAVDRFAVAMKAKLAQKRAEGRGGWENKDECGQGYLSELLAEHVRKGDPVDVANLAMMLHQRGERIDAAALRRSTETDKPGVREAALEEAAKVADMFAADHAKSADQFGIDRNRELHNAAKGAAQGVAFAIRALSARITPAGRLALSEGKEAGT